MAFNKDQLMLKEMKFYYGTVTDPHLIDTDTDPKDSFNETDTVGFIRMRTDSIGLNDTFAEYLSGTPHKRIRMDLIQRDVKLNFTINQLNADYLNIFLNADTEKGVFDLIHLGSDAPVKTRYAWLGEGTLVNGDPISILIYAGEVVTTDKSLNMSGSDYVDLPVEIMAFEHEDFETNPDDEHNYGVIWLGNLS